MAKLSRTSPAAVGDEEEILTREKSYESDSDETQAKCSVQDYAAIANAAKHCARKTRCGSAPARHSLGHDGSTPEICPVCFLPHRIMSGPVRAQEKYASRHLCDCGITKQ